MKKNFLLLPCLLAMLACCSQLFVACGDDDDENEQNSELDSRLFGVWSADKYTYQDLETGYTEANISVPTDDDEYGEIIFHSNGFVEAYSYAVDNNEETIHPHIWQQQYKVRYKTQDGHIYVQNGASWRKIWDYSVAGNILTMIERDEDFVDTDYLVKGSRLGQNYTIE